MTFRTPSEALELANNTMYGLAASVWSENINQSLHLAPSLQAGVVWVNCTNQFDAACGFGGYRESGYGREGGREGLLEYMKPKVTAFTGKKLKRPDVHGLGHTTTLKGSKYIVPQNFSLQGNKPDQMVERFGQFGIKMVHWQVPWDRAIGKIFAMPWKPLKRQAHGANPVAT
jgi:aldehyde dehydrogenase (NAD+)